MIDHDARRGHREAESRSHNNNAERTLAQRLSLSHLESDPVSLRLWAPLSSLVIWAKG